MRSVYDFRNKGHSRLRAIKCQPVLNCLQEAQLNAKRRCINDAADDSPTEATAIEAVDYADLPADDNSDNSVCISVKLGSILDADEPDLVVDGTAAAPITITTDMRQT